jgi:carbohydrate-selective porin OprB
MTLVPWLAVTPDVQYVYDPGGVAGTPDAWIVALRVRATL